MELRQLRYFAAVGAEGHFTRAAEIIGIAQPALSVQISQLERELGVRLFDRTSRTVRLTDAGRTLYAHATRILADVDRTVDDMQGYAGLKRGRIAIGSLQLQSQLVLPRALADFHNRYPGIEVTLREGTSDALLLGMVEGNLDAAVVHVQSQEWAQDVICEDILTEPLLLAVPPVHRYAHRKRVSFTDLADESFIFFKAGSGINQVILDRAREAGFTPRVSFESTDSQTIRALVAEGLGVTLQRPLFFEMPGPPVVAVPITPKIVLTLLLATPKNRRPSAAAAAFLPVLREHLGVSGRL